MDPVRGQITSFPEDAVPPHLKTQVREIQDEAWPAVPGSDERTDAPIHDPALRPVSMLLLDHDTVLAALDVLVKDLRHAGGRYVAGGLSTVATRHAVRGRGYGHRLVAAASQAMAEMGLDLGLFTCDRPLQPFYERAGWQPLPETVIIGGTPDAPFPSDQPGFDKVAVASFFSPAARAHIRSFHHAQIELYPGEIDKLW